MADGRAPFFGALACPHNIPFGSRVTLIGRAGDASITVQEVADAGGL